MSTREPSDDPTTGPTPPNDPTMTSEASNHPATRSTPHTRHRQCVPAVGNPHLPSTTRTRGCPTSCDLEITKGHPLSPTRFASLVSQWRANKLHPSPPICFSNRGQHSITLHSQRWLCHVSKSLSSPFPCCTAQHYVAEPARLCNVSKFGYIHSRVCRWWPTLVCTFSCFSCSRWRTNMDLSSSSTRHRDRRRTE